MGRPANRPEDVWRYVDKRGDDECWSWLGAKQKGYGVIGIKHRNYRVPRIICCLRNAEEISMRAEKNGPDCRIVLHSCDNPSCCNPKHLSVGKPKDNTHDMIRKGRNPDRKGENGGRAKLTHSDVERIREAYRFGALQKDLAAVYGVSGSTISTAIHGIYYGSVV